MQNIAKLRYMQQKLHYTQLSTLKNIYFSLIFTKEGERVRKNGKKHKMLHITQ